MVGAASVDGSLSKTSWLHAIHPICGLGGCNGRIHCNVSYEVQVLKPGVEDILNTDLSFLYASARILEFFNPELSRTSLVGVVSDIRKSMLQVNDLTTGSGHGLAVAACGLCFFGLGTFTVCAHRLLFGSSQQTACASVQAAAAQG